MEMAGNHRADPNTIHIIRTCRVEKAKDIRRDKTLAFRV